MGKERSFQQMWQGQLDNYMQKNESELYTKIHSEEIRDQRSQIL